MQHGIIFLQMSYIAKAMHCKTKLHSSQLIFLFWIIYACQLGSAQGIECRYTELGTEYRGLKNTTKSGITCQNWDSDDPHRHNHSSDILNNNYCRNPDKTPGGGPWCFTTNITKRWEFCGIPVCEVNLDGAKLKLLKDKDYPPGYAKLAVDRKVSTCVHANISSNKKVRLTIISEQQLDISAIVIVTNNQVPLNLSKWINGMEVKVGNDSSIRNGIVCSTFNRSLPTSGEAVVWCDRVLSGKYIWLIKRKDSLLLHICEIKIYGKSNNQITKRISTAQAAKGISVDSSNDMYSTILFTNTASRFTDVYTNIHTIDSTGRYLSLSSRNTFLSTGRYSSSSSGTKFDSTGMYSSPSSGNTFDSTGMYSSPSSRNEFDSTGMYKSYELSSMLEISDATEMSSLTSSVTLLFDNVSSGMSYFDSSIMKTNSPNSTTVAVITTGVSEMETSIRTYLALETYNSSFVESLSYSSQLKTSLTPFSTSRDSTTVAVITTGVSEMETSISTYLALETYNSSFAESSSYSSQLKTSFTPFSTSPDSANISMTVPTSSFASSPQSTVVLYTTEGLTTVNFTSSLFPSTSELPDPSATYSVHLNTWLISDSIVTASVSEMKPKTSISSHSVLETYNSSYIEPSFYSSPFETSLISFTSQDASSPISSSIIFSPTFSTSRINLTVLMSPTGALSTDTKISDTSVIIKNESVMTLSSIFASSVLMSSSSFEISPSRPVTETSTPTKDTTKTTIVPTTTVASRQDTRKEDKSIVTPVAVSLVVVIIIGGIIVIVLLYRKKILSRVFKDKEKHEEEGVVLTPIVNKPNRQPAAPLVNGRGKKEHVKLMDFRSSLSSPIAVTELHKQISVKRKGNVFSKEFSSFPSGMVLPRDVGSLEANKTKNRYVNMISYDHSRVVLDDRDYINANYVDSFDRQRAYIATQGPLQKTVGEFWKMIWQENVGKIVMLTNLQEQRKIKCHKYWPSKDKKIKLENLIVSLDKDEEYPIFNLRKIKLTDEMTNKTKQVTQFHFTVWPDHGVPDTFQLLLFHDWVVNYSSLMKGPTAVHCSAGVGRTGTYIALDALKSQGLLTEEVDIYLYVEYMRKCRVNMVQTLEQYMFIHDVLLEYFVCPDSMCETELIKDNWYLNDTRSQNHKLTAEFKIVDLLRPKYSTSQYSEALKEENIYKNRNSDILAVNECRVELDTGGEGSDYINAVILPSMSNKKGYFVAEIPVECMQSSFWQMVYDFNSNIVILLDSPEDSQDVFYPTNVVTISRKPYNITRTSCKGENDSIRREYLTVTNEKYEEKSQVLLLSVQNWVSDSSVMPPAELMLSLHMETKKWQEGNGEEFITVVCRDGATRCGLFCAVSNIIDCIDHYDKVDLLKTVRQLQICRPEIMQQAAQYKYCLQSAIRYADTLDHTYVNA